MPIWAARYRKRRKNGRISQGDTRVAREQDLGPCVRRPIWFFANICGMALGGWLAGALYDQLGTYAPAFAVGVTFNLANIVLIGWLAARIR